MSYDIQDLLGLLRREGGVALYLSQGSAPILAIPSRPPDASLASVLLIAVEGPVLNREDLETILEDLKIKTEYFGTFGSSGYAGIGEFRYRNGPHDLDVFLFKTDGKILIEFRDALPAT